MSRKALLGSATFLAAAAFLASGPAMAGGHVNWSVNVGAGVPVYSGPVYAVPQPVYAPQPIYAPPQVVYAPQPVYAQPQPVFYSGIVPYGQVVYYDGWRRPYYVHGGRPVYFREGYGRHHHGHW
jgi:hypothetical protein